jgi:DNA-binding MarR family transcriptional regulator
MREDALERVRSFNRTVSAAIGALDDRFLGRDRPMGEARLLWEVGMEGAAVRDLRLRLGLDSGYCSRLLRSLERQGLLLTMRDAGDARVRRVRLTEAGRTERAELDRRSEVLARSLIEPLSEHERERLVRAMAEVERLLVRARTVLTEEPPDSPDVLRCFRRYFAELDRRFEGGFDARKSSRLDPGDLMPPEGLVLIARMGEDPLACGALRLHAGGIAEIKRMWVAPRARGLGLGRLILGELERRAVDRGARVARLDTNRVLTEAIALYRRAGYHEGRPFNDEPYADHWFEKPLGSAPSRGRPIDTAG